jgi:FkbM family methyltransferase
MKAGTPSIPGSGSGDYPPDLLLSEYERFETMCVLDETGRGRATVLGWDLEYPAATSMLSFIDQILFRRMNDFPAATDAPVILDCGANIGYTALHYKRCYPKARITAFEPDPQFLPLLRRNLARNEATDVDVVPAAAWLANGTASWIMEARDGSRLGDSPTGQRSTIVPTVDLRRYLRQDIDLLKLDIEGAEFDVVPHLASSLDRVGNVIVECHITDQSKYDGLGRLMTTLSTAGFRISINSWGPWRDLTRRHLVDALHAEQYLTVYGWRGDESARSTEATHLPYVGLSQYRHAAGLQGVRRHHEDVGRLVGELLQGSSATVHRIKGGFRKERGRCWYYRLPATFPSGDSNATGEASTLVLENQRALGPGHAAHDDIRVKGGGLYSHWGSSLYLSTTDDSDPNTNGRVYTVVTLRTN